VSIAASNYGHEIGAAIRLARASAASFACSDTSSIAIAGRYKDPGCTADIDRADSAFAAALEEIGTALNANVGQTSVCRSITTT